MKDDRCIYVILTKFGSAYSVFVSNFYASREALGSAYKEPSLESFCDSPIQEKDKIVQLRFISTVSTSNEALLAQRKDKSKNPKK
jgi:hypothetical protein